jgi:hypothetical protein
MAESAQYGILVDFMRRVMGCESVDDLLELFFEVAERFNINTSLCLRGEETLCLSPQRRQCSPIEANLFELMHNGGRLYHFGARTMVNDTHVSFLIKNMPIDDEKSYGRIKDVIAVLSEAMESAFLSIQRKQALSAALFRVDIISERLNRIFAEENGISQSLQRLHELMRDLESSFHFLDLSEEQERVLYGLLDRGSNDAGSILEIMNEIQGDMTYLADALRV